MLSAKDIKQRWRDHSMMLAQTAILSKSQQYSAVTKIKIKILTILWDCLAPSPLSRSGCGARLGEVPCQVFSSFQHIYIILKYVYFTLRRACVTILFVFATFGRFWHVIWTVSGHGGSYCDGDRDGLRRWDWVEPEAIRLPICLCSGCLGGRFPHVFKLW